MSEWQQTEPPVDREIEFEKDGRAREIGVLSYGGTGGIGRPGQVRMKQLYTIKGRALELFEVTRWREVEK